MMNILFKFLKVWLNEKKPQSLFDGSQGGSPHKGGSGTDYDSRGLAKGAGSFGWKGHPATGGVKRPHWYKPGTIA